MKKVIPPILFILCIAVMIGLNIFVPEQKYLEPPYTYLGILLIIIGLVMAIRIRKIFDQIGTEIDTFKRPRKLVKSGLFRISRNPIYLGFTISLIGIWLLIGNLVSLIGIVIFFLISNIWYIPYEEKNMEKEFGNDYKVYKSKVRRWI